MCLLNLIYVVYMAYVRPYERKLDNLRVIICDFLNFVGCGYMVVLVRGVVENPE